MILRLTVDSRRECREQEVARSAGSVALENVQFWSTGILSRGEKMIWSMLSRVNRAAGRRRHAGSVEIISH